MGSEGFKTFLCHPEWNVIRRRILVITKILRSAQNDMCLALERHK